MSRPDDDIGREAAAIRARASAQNGLERAAGHPVRLDWVADPEAPADPRLRQASDALYRREPPSIEGLLQRARARAAAIGAARPVTREGVALGAAVGRLQAATAETVALIARVQASAKRAAP